jgi:hypothetical protein
MPLPTEPGVHTLTLAAVGHKTQARTVLVRIPGTMRAQVEPFDTERSVASAPSRQPAAPTPSAQDHSATLSSEDAPRSSGHAATATTIGWALGVVGGAALGVGAGFGFRAISLKNEADSIWCTNHLCTPHGLSLIDDAKTAATIATIGVVAGIAGVGAGAWWVLHSTPAFGHAQVAGYLAPDRAGLVWRGAW